MNLYGRTGDLVWRNPGDVTSFPRPNITAELGAIGVGTARALQDLSYIRLKQVTLSYNLPSNLLNKMFLDNAKVYVQGINLLTFTNYTGLDPEFTGGSQTGIFPPSKNFTVGVQFGF